LAYLRKAPEGSIVRTETALDLLERVKLVTEKWVNPGHRDGANSHNVSATISLRDNEWEEVGNWMWKNREFLQWLISIAFRWWKLYPSTF
jgi:ribonucleoside-triphosphate reductase (thioredoxin)